MTKPWTIMASVAMVTLTLAGCEKKPGGQVVAVVNGEEITQQDLNAELQGNTIPQSADRKAVMAQVLQRVIDRTLLVQKAKAEGLDKSPTYISQLRRAQDDIVINLLSSKAAKGVAIPDASAVDHFISTNPSLFSDRKVYKLDQIIFAQPADVAVLHRLEPAKTLNEIAATLNAMGIQYTRGASQLDTAVVPPGVAAKIAALPAGEPFITPDRGKIVASVITATVANPTPAAQAKPAATNLLRQQALGAVLQKQLEAARSTAKIAYQPSFAPSKNMAGTGTPKAMGNSNM